MSKVVFRLIGVAIVCGLGLCVYFLNKTVRLRNALERLEGERSHVMVSKIAEEQKLIEEGLKKKYSAQLVSFANLAQELQIEKDKTKKLEILQNRARNVATTP